MRFLCIQILTFKAPIATAADRQHWFFFSETTSLDISCESSAKQMIHMICQYLFSLKKKKKKIECRLLQILLSARVKQFTVLQNILLLFGFNIFLVHLLTVLYKKKRAIINHVTKKGLFVLNFLSYLLWCKIKLTLLSQTQRDVWALRKQ